MDEKCSVTRASSERFSVFLACAPQVLKGVELAFHRKKSLELQDELRFLRAACVYCGLEDAQDLIRGFIMAVEHNRFPENNLILLLKEMHRVSGGAMGTLGGGTAD